MVNIKRGRKMGLSLQQRLTRLNTDHEKMCSLRESSDLIDFRCAGNPPNKYVIIYRCKGMVPGRFGSEPSIKEYHEVGIDLSAGYPLSSPIVDLRTPIYHPNVKGHTLCYGNYGWTPAKKLDDFVLWIGNVIVYRHYDLDSPLDYEAAAWASKNEHLFPLDDRGWIRNAEELVQIIQKDKHETVLSTDAIKEVTDDTVIIQEVDESLEIEIIDI
jgi:ubiquitin-protein ligase